MWPWSSGTSAVLFLAVFVVVAIVGLLVYLLVKFAVLEALLQVRRDERPGEMPLRWECPECHDVIYTSEWAERCECKKHGDLVTMIMTRRGSEK